MDIVIKPGVAIGPDMAKPLPQGLLPHVLEGAQSYFYQFDFGSLLWQELNQLGYLLCFLRFTLNRPAAFEVSCPGPVTALQATLEGHISGIIKDNIGVQLHAGSIGLLYLPAGLHQADLKKGVTDSFHIEMETGHIKELLDDWPRQKEVLDRMQQAREHGMLFPRLPLSYLMKETLERIKQGTAGGIGQKLHLRSRVGDLINHYLSGTEEKRRLQALPGQPNQEVLIKIWQDIKANPSIKRFSLSRIAAEYYLHKNTLQRTFQKLFGIRLHKHVEQQCMNKATHLLTHTDESLDTIADTLGYSNNSSFRRAFLRVMKRPPESFRNAR